VFALGLAVGDGAGQLQHLHRVRERDASRDLGGFEHSFGGASVTVFGAAIQDGDVFPGKGFQLGVQAGLVGLDGEDVVAAGLDDGLGGLALAVQGVLCRGGCYADMAVIALVRAVLGVLVSA